jgi:hypothetical protein
MFNPLVDSLTDLSDSDLEQKTIELSRKYWMTSNPQIQSQISTILFMYQDELSARRAQSMQKSSDDQQNGLDNLINIS